MFAINDTYTKNIGGSRSQKMKAWYGDMVLGAAVARELINQRPRIHNAVALHGTAVSNEILSSKATTILPNIPKQITEDETFLNLSEHAIGTIVEAAIAEVNEIDEAAVKDLAVYLVKISRNVPINRRYLKAKFRELGGVVDIYQKNRHDQKPLFEATARIRGRTAFGVSRTKLKAEKIAIETLLTKMGIIESLKVEEEE